MAKMYSSSSLTNNVTYPVARHPPNAGLEALCREQERRKRVLGWRRTHKDPFAGEWEQILSWLVANPERA
jgi:hypothetical protein